MSVFFVSLLCVMLGGFMVLSVWLWSVHTILALIVLALVGVPGVLFYLVFVLRVVISGCRALRVALCGGLEVLEVIS